MERMILIKYLRYFKFVEHPNDQNWPEAENTPDFGKISFPDMSPIDLSILFNQNFQSNLDLMIMIKNMIKLDPVVRIRFF